MTPTVLVTDGDQRSALAIVRSLGRAGHHVQVGSGTGRSLAGASRWAEADHRLPDPLADPDGHAEAVAAVARKSAADVVLPVTDASILSILRARDRLGCAVVPCGEEEAFRGLSDKERVGEAAREVGIRVPRQRVLRSPDDDAPEGLSWPVVVKPSRSVAPEAERRRKETVKHAADPDELATELDRLAPSAFPVLLQQRIRGPGLGVFLLRWDGGTRAVFGHRRLREKPPSGGVSVYRESIRPDPDLVSRSERLMAAFGWSGLAMVECKVDRETGTPFLMEVNARPWGSLQLAVDAGVDFPRLLVEAALGAPAEPLPDYREDVRLRWLWGDVDHLIARMRGAVPTGADDGGDGRPRRLRALADFLAWRRGDRLEVLRTGDPRPFLRETAAWLRAALGAGRPG